MDQACGYTRSVITDLDDVCLSNVFKRVGVLDQLNLVNTCVRFRSVVKEMIWRNTFRETFINTTGTDQIKNEDYQEIFRHTSEFMEQLTIADRKHLIVPSEKKATVDRPFEFYFSLPFPRLTSFEFHGDRLDDELLRLIVEKCPQLQRLFVSSDYITGAHVKKLRNLQLLYLPYCSLQTEHLSDILASCVKITRLDISGFRDFVQALGTKQVPKLRFLQMSAVPRIHELVDFLDDVGDDLSVVFTRD